MEGNGFWAWRLKTCVSTGCIQSEIHKPERYAYDGHHKLDTSFMTTGRETIPEGIFEDLRSETEPPMTFSYFCCVSRPLDLSSLNRDMITEAYIQGEVELDCLLLSSSNDKVIKLTDILNVFQVGKLYNKKLSIFSFFFLVLWFYPNPCPCVFKTITYEQEHRCIENHSGSNTIGVIGYFIDFFLSFFLKNKVVCHSNDMTYWSLLAKNIQNSQRADFT